MEYTKQLDPLLLCSERGQHALITLLLTVLAVQSSSTSTFFLFDSSGTNYVFVLTMITHDDLSALLYSYTGVKTSVWAAGLHNNIGVSFGEMSFA
jgi:hypothetical protein